MTLLEWFTFVWSFIYSPVLDHAGMHLTNRGCSMVAVAGGTGRRARRSNTFNCESTQTCPYLQQETQLSSKKASTCHVTFERYKVRYSYVLSLIIIQTRFSKVPNSSINRYNNFLRYLYFFQLHSESKSRHIKSCE